MSSIEISTSVPKKPAVVLLSGGLDSATVAAIAAAEGFRVNALSFAYGQRHSFELEAARRVAASLGVAQHRIATIDLRVFGGSALTDNIDVPKGRDSAEMEHGIPVTYVPARNTIFLSFALAWAEVLGASDVFIGVNALDYSGYPDCRPEFIHAFETMANLATKAGVEGRQRLRDSYAADATYEGTDHPKRDGSRRGLQPDEQLLRSGAGWKAVRAVRLLFPAEKRIQGKRDRRSAALPGG